MSLDSSFSDRSNSPAPEPRRPMDTNDTTPSEERIEDRDRSRSPVPESQSPGDTNGKTSSSLEPKHISKPVTCFYWKTLGHCSKNYDDCAYAHYDTGNMASPPVLKAQATETGETPQTAVDPDAQGPLSDNDVEPDDLLFKTYRLFILLGEWSESLKSEKKILRELEAALETRRSCVEQYEKNVQAKEELLAKKEEVLELRSLALSV